MAARKTITQAHERRRGAGASESTGMAKRNSETKTRALIMVSIISQEGHGIVSPVWADKKSEQEMWWGEALIRD
jgi:hypothetical protein